jgi:hypothetical protein
MQDLELDRLFVVYPGSLAYPIAEKISVLPINRFAETNLVDLLSLS